MSMISFLFIGLVISVWLVLIGINKFVSDKELKLSYANATLLLVSYLSIAYADLKCMGAIIALTIITWYAAKNKLPKLGVIFALLMLGYFKYTNFFIDSIVNAFGIANIGALNIILPLGISFYTFSAISYILDCCHDKLPARNLQDVALYLSFFPKITCGPIQKSMDFFKQLDSVREVNWQTFTKGSQIFAFGLFKKLVLADRLAVFVDQVYSVPLAFDSTTIFLATIAYTFQIYFDFSGYTDMAIGVAKIIGFEMPMNFNLPYMAYNITEFWKRWHVSLSQWLQEYLYIGLGGNRGGALLMYRNLFLTMLLGGIWHGANWTYIFWGGIHGLGLIIHKLWKERNPFRASVNSLIYNFFSVVLTFLFVNYCWVFFRAENIDKALLIITRSTSFDAGLNQMYFWLFLAVFVHYGCVLIAYLKNRKSEDYILVKDNPYVCPINGYYPSWDFVNFWDLVWFFVFCGLLLCLAYTNANPFIYGRY